MNDNFNLAEFMTSVGIPVSRVQVGGKSVTVRGPSFIQDQVNFGRSTGYARPNRYCILFQGVPSSIEMRKQDNGVTWGIDNKRLSLNCLQATLPDASLNTSDMQVVGPRRSIPHTQNFGDNNASFQFNCGTDLYEYTLFRAWQRTIIDPVSRYVSYYDDYAKSCSLTLIPIPNNVYNYAHMLELLNEHRLYGVRLTEVYPRSVGVNQFQNTSTNNVLIANINFAYRELLPFWSWDDDVKYAVHAGISQIMDMTSNTVRVSDNQLRGIRKDLTAEEKERLKASWLAKSPFDLNQGIFGSLLGGDTKDPTGLPPNAGEPDLFLNNLTTSGINTTALFRGI